MAVGRGGVAIGGGVVHGMVDRGMVDGMVGGGMMNGMGGGMMNGVVDRGGMMNSMVRGGVVDSVSSSTEVGESSEGHVRAGSHEGDESNQGKGLHDVLMWRMIPNECEGR